MAQVMVHIFSLSTIFLNEQQAQPIAMVVVVVV
jgi:hypothetical protein